MSKNELREKRHQAFLKLQSIPVTEKESFQQAHKEYNDLCEQWFKLLGYQL